MARSTRTSPPARRACAALADLRVRGRRLLARSPDPRARERAFPQALAGRGLSRAGRLGRAAPRPRGQPCAATNASISREQLAARSRAGSHEAVIELRARATMSSRVRPSARCTARVVGGQVAVEVRGVVGVHGDEHAGVEQPLERVLRQVRRDLQLEVAERAHRERDPLARQALLPGPGRRRRARRGRCAPPAAGRGPRRCTPPGLLRRRARR